MKSVTMVLCVVLVFSAGVFAQSQNKTKSEPCESSQECNLSYPCVEKYCGCKHGYSVVIESHPGGEHVEICQKVVGRGCLRDEDCSKDLEHAKCDNNEKRCVCLAENNCKDGAASLTVLSATTLLLVTGVLKMWY